MTQQVGARCANKTSDIWVEKEKPLPDVPITHVAVIWSQPWVTSLYVESYLCTWSLWGGLNWAIDARDGAMLHGTVGCGYRKILPGRWVWCSRLPACLGHREMKAGSPAGLLSSSLCSKLAAGNKEGREDTGRPFSREIPGLSPAGFLCLFLILGWGWYLQ